MASSRLADRRPIRSSSVNGPFPRVEEIPVSPKGEWKGLLKRNPGLHQRGVAALQSLDTAAITGNGRVYGGGSFQMEPKQLAGVPARFLLGALAADLPKEAGETEVPFRRLGG